MALVARLFAASAKRAYGIADRDVNGVSAVPLRGARRADRAEQGKAGVCSVAITRPRSSSGTV